MAPVTEPARAPERDGRWSLRRLGVVLYPFVAAAMAINIFLCALMLQAVGLPNVAPVTALSLGALAGVPASWATARWVRGTDGSGGIGPGGAAQRPEVSAGLISPIVETGEASGMS